MIVEWCPAEGGCRGGFCERALKWAGHPTMALAKPFEEGRRQRDVLQLLTADLARAAVPRATDGARVLSPPTAEYEVHTTQDAEGNVYWTALYAGHVELSQLLDHQLPWTEEAAEAQARTELEAFAARHPADAAERGRRVW